MASETASLWNSVQWQPWRDSSDQQRAWQKSSVPYIRDANALQNLSIWIPSTAAEPPSEVSSLKGIWVVYIHGGAWRDPKVTAAAFAPTVAQLFRSHASTVPKIAGLASINYTLSPHPEHPADPSRSGRHPDHILDVLRGLAFLQDTAGFGHNFVLLGHSCGATLTFQVLMDASRWKSEQLSSLKVAKPSAVVGLNGLYDLPNLIDNPGDKHAVYSPIYEQFTRGAFGDNERLWRDVSPTYTTDWVKEWGIDDGKVALVQSKEDTLVPYRQLEGMMQALRPSKDAGLDVFELSASDDHDELWAKGDRIAEIIVDVVNRLST